MKKISIILLALSLILCFAACRSKDKNPIVPGDESTHISSEVYSDNTNENNESTSSTLDSDQASKPADSDKNTESSKTESDKETAVKPDGTQTSSKKDDKNENTNVFNNIVF